MIKIYKKKYIYCIGLFSNNSEVRHGCIFLSYIGNKYNASNFILEVVKKNKFLTISDQKLYLKNNIFYIINIFNIKKIMPNFINKIYSNKFTMPNIIGITGTNGKTTISYLVYYLLNKINLKCALIGTLGFFHKNYYKRNILTTPNICQLYKFIYKFQEKQIKYLSIELSSIGIDQKRMLGISFDILIFTNLTHDHLDYHKTFFKYKNSKFDLFLKYKYKTSIINIDCIYGLQLFTIIKDQYTYTVSIKKKKIKNKSTYLKSIKCANNKISVFFVSPWCKKKINFPILSIFNFKNFLILLNIFLLKGISITKLKNILNYMPSISGRLQKINNNNGTLIYLDYAHNPNALKNVLLFLKSKKKKIWLIIGSGGNRDQYKRKYISMISEIYGDKIIFTSDNPRNENIKNIFENMLFGTKNKGVILIKSRKYAIKYALHNSNKNDVIIVCGKGHERYQIVNEQYEFYSDYLLISNLIEKNVRY